MSTVFHKTHRTDKVAFSLISSSHYCANAWDFNCVERHQKRRKHKTLNSQTMQKKITHFHILNFFESILLVSTFCLILIVHV